MTTTENFTKLMVFIFTSNQYLMCVCVCVSVIRKHTQRHIFKIAINQIQEILWRVTFREGGRKIRRVKTISHSSAVKVLALFLCMGEKKSPFKASSSAVLHSWLRWVIWTRAEGLYQSSKAEKWMKIEFPWEKEEEEERAVLQTER